MDPDEALKKAREALARIRAASAESDSEEPSDSQAWVQAWNDLRALLDLADAFEALDGWLSKGGFLPENWSSAGSLQYKCGVESKQGDT
jgi:hypothetical protein